MTLNFLAGGAKSALKNADALQAMAPSPCRLPATSHQKTHERKVPKAVTVQITINSSHEVLFKTQQPHRLHIISRHTNRTTAMTSDVLSTAVNDELPDIMNCYLIIIELT